MVTDFILDTLVKSILQFVITNNEELDGLTSSILNNTLSEGIKIGNDKISEYQNNFNQRVKNEILKSLKRHRWNDNESEFIITQFSDLLNTVSNMELSERPAFFDRNSLYDSLKKLHEKSATQLSDEDMKIFREVLYDLTPLLIREQANAKGYAYELVLECFKHILQIQSGTADINQRIERMEQFLTEERLQPELPTQTFYRLWEQSLKAEFSTPENRLEKHMKLLSFLDDQITQEMFDELCLELPETSGEADPPLAQFMCVGNSSRRPLFYAQTLVWLANAWAEQYKTNPSLSSESCQIEDRLKHAEKSIETAQADNLSFTKETVRCQRFCENLKREIQSVRQELSEHSAQLRALQGPAVRTNRTDDTHPFFEPVYSGSFDSVTGYLEERMEDMELNLFQLAASGKTILLQGPQIMDNLNMLKLMDTGGFRELCRKGIVVFSAYGNIKTPGEFLISRLQEPGFKFSSFPEYNDPDVGRKMRKIISRGLTEGLIFSQIKDEIPEEFRTRMEVLYDSYLIAGECFQKEETMKYHQVPETRTTHFPLVSQDRAWRDEKLPGVIRSKLKDLKDDQEKNPIPGREEYLEQFQILEERSRQYQLHGNQTGCQIRSDYEHFIDSCAEEGAYSSDTLEKFRQLVHNSYLFYNGKLSCEKIILPMNDPVLQIHHRNQELQENVFSVDYAYKRYKRTSRTEQAVTGWSDLINCVLAAREVIIDQTIPACQKADMMGRETGLVYETVLDKTQIAAKMSIRTSKRKQVDFSTQDFGNDSTCETEECYL